MRVYGPLCMYWRMKNARIIISGGGTGGHIYPAIAIADALKHQNLGVDILFVGASGKMEMQKVPEAGYPIVGLEVRGFQRKQLWQNLGVPLRVLTSLQKARGILKNFQPDVVIGTGGYASAPVLYTAAKQKVPTLIQEQNAIPGLANRILARYVDIVCAAYTSLTDYIPNKKVVLTGNPIRREVTELSKKKEAAYAHFGLVPDKKCLLVLGGSLGARNLNESIVQAVGLLIRAGLQIIWATGQVYFEAIRTQFTKEQTDTVRLYPFIGAMDLAYAASDIVVSRAGALAVAELCVARKPVIFVPSPNVTADHQTQNVLPLIKDNAALIVRDSEAKRSLAQVILELFHAQEKQKTLTINIARWAKPNATEAVVQEVERLTHHSQSSRAI